MDEKDIVENIKTQRKMGQEILDFNTVIDRVGDGITVSDKEGHFEIFNKRMQEITGYDIKEANSLHDFTVLLYPEPQERGLALGRLNDVMTVNGYREIETTIRAKDGSKKVLLVSTSFIRYGNREMFLSVYHDITEHKKTELEIEHLASFPKLNPYPVLELNVSGDIIFSNKAAFDILEKLGIKNDTHAFLPKNIKDIIGSLRSQSKHPYYCEININSMVFGEFIDYMPEFDTVRIYAVDITERKQQEELVRANEERYRSYIELTGQLGWTTNGYGEVEEDIPSFRKFTGQTYEEVRGSGWSKALHPDDLQNTLKIWEKAVTKKSTYEVEYRVRRYDGVYRYFLARGVPIFKEDGAIREWVGICIDITERKQQEELLRISEEKCRSIVTTSMDGFWLVDTKGCFLEVNEAYSKMTGYTREELLKMCISDVSVAFTPDEIKQRIQKIIDSRHERFETRHRCKDGRIIDVEISANYTEVRGEGLFFVFLRDITERKWLQKELEQLAVKDSHTGLFNHRYLKEAIESTLSRAERKFTPFSVIMMDLDYFKSINDVYGHLFGDLVLKQFAEQLKKIVRAYDIVIRYGGEEFIIVSSDTDRENALVLARRILEKVNLFNFGDAEHKVKLKLSLGICSYPQDNVFMGMDMVKSADQALIKAKESGGNRVCSFLDLKAEGEIITEKPDVDSLKKKIDKLTVRANQGLIESIFAFAKTIELKDHYTGAHVEKSVHYATKIAQELNLSKENIELFKQATMLHDLGKIGISETILHKKSKLNEKEFAEIKKHPQIGVDIIRPIQSLHPIIPLILYHHERWDGKGYPHGLKKESIPLGARIIAIADVYQALVSNRPYRKAYSKAKAIKIIKEGSGTHFDPEIVKVFLKILKQEK